MKGFRQVLTIGEGPLAWKDSWHVHLFGPKLILDQMFFPTNFHESRPRATHMDKKNTTHTAQWNKMITIWGVENFFWIPLGDGLSGIANYDHFRQFGLLKERMVTAESDVKFSIIRSLKIANEITGVTFLKKTLKTTYIFSTLWGNKRSDTIYCYKKL